MCVGVAAVMCFLWVTHIIWLKSNLAGAYTPRRVDSITEAILSCKDIKWVNVICIHKKKGQRQQKLHPDSLWRNYKQDLGGHSSDTLNFSLVSSLGQHLKPELCYSLVDFFPPPIHQNVFSLVSLIKPTDRQPLYHWPMSLHLFIRKAFISWAHASSSLKRKPHKFISLRMVP